MTKQTQHDRAERERAERERRRLASLEAAIRTHYNDPTGRRILARRGMPLTAANRDQEAAA